ncbi:MAG: tonB dependent receptor family protein [Novosphingobium lindaniclasticum]|jgi:iron complex outermembrane receptor protein|uniref:TonB-dependent receptor n=1 Tax=Novosphingobium lindaniclasticum TaxID=1329895 RepID=UPI002409E093|nr:TonB-dependent receptor [Novosphingobium lindaniclasticum]MDF2640348.1 tonB dependent receptor family protein [Novosphingobium lindaniclasticum]
MRNSLLKTAALVSVSMLATLHGQAAMAQDAAAPAETEDAAAPPGLAEIVVTAQRRSENLQRAAVAVSAVPGDALVSAGISETAGLSRLVPSLQVTPSGGSSTSFYLRGVGTLQSNSFGENPIAFNYAGVYVARPTAPIGAFYDLERVEVVKGPQGTLYGRNATGGAINVLPRRPELDSFSGDLTLEYGNYDTKKASGAINLPVSESVALRVAGQVVDRDGYLSDGYNDEVGQAARASLLIKPEGAFTLNVVADFFHQGGKGVGGQLAPGARFGNPSGFAYPGYAAPSLSDRIGGSDPRSIAALAASPAPAPAFLANGFVAPPRGDGYNDSNFYGLSATLDADVGFGTVTFVPAYRKSDVNFRNYTFGFLGEVKEKSEQVSFELRLASNETQRLRYVLGAYYFKEDQDADNRFYQGIISDTAFQPKLETESKAVFGQFTFDLVDNVRLVAGGRYTDESKSVDGPVQLYAPPAGSPPRTARVVTDLKFNKFTWKAGIEADVGPRSLVYANVSTGFKAGGFFVGGFNNTFAPENLTAYTIGTKNRFLDNRLQFNLEAFYWDYKDQQISFVGPVELFQGVFIAGGKTVNAGNARFYGAEADLRLALSSHGVLSANVLYNNSKYTELNYVAISAGGSPLRNGCSTSADTSVPVAAPARLFNVDCRGQQALNAPRWSGNVAYEHTFDLGSDYHLVANARTRLSSSFHVSLEYLPEQRQDSFMQSDASLTLQAPDDRWSLTAFVNNIEDKTLVVAGFARPVLQTVYVVTGAPRTYGVRAGVKF